MAASTAPGAAVQARAPRPPRLSFSPWWTRSACCRCCGSTASAMRVRCPPKLPLVPAGDTGELGRVLIDTFGKGWAKADVDLLASVCAPNAVFVETPFSEPIRGAEAIRRWWLDVPYSHSEITFASGEIFAAGPWFS